MIRKFLYIMVILFAMSNIAFGADASSSSTSSAATTSNQFVDGSYIINSSVSIDSTQLKCRPLKDKKYKTQIVGYDLMSGIIKCAIIPNDTNVIEVPRSENANRLYTQATFEKYYEDEKTSVFKKASDAVTSLFQDKIVTEKVEVEEGETLSSYLSGLAVLNGMDADSTAGIKYSQKIAEKGIFSFSGNKQGDTISDTTNIANNLNKSNIEYFENLFTNMNTVYIHLQNLLFIVMGGFFLATLGGGKIQKYLENRGQSTGNKEPYLHKFFIPLLCAGVFYMPITSGGGVNFALLGKGL